MTPSADDDDDAKRCSVRSVRHLAGRFEQPPSSPGNRQRAAEAAPQRLAAPAVSSPSPARHSSASPGGVDVPDRSPFGCRSNQLLFSAQAGRRDATVSSGERPRTKKSVTFCDQVTLVATADDEQDDSYLPNPILQRILGGQDGRSHQSVNLEDRSRPSGSQERSKSPAASHVHQVSALVHTSATSEAAPGAKAASWGSPGLGTGVDAMVMSRPPMPPANHTSGQHSGSPATAGQQYGLPGQQPGAAPARSRDQQRPTTPHNTPRPLPPYQHPPPPRDYRGPPPGGRSPLPPSGRSVNPRLVRQTSDVTGRTMSPISCELCSQRPRLAGSTYCADCQAYMARLRPQTTDVSPLGCRNAS